MILEGGDGYWFRWGVQYHKDIIQGLGSRDNMGQRERERHLYIYV